MRGIFLGLALVLIVVLAVVLLHEPDPAERPERERVEGVDDEKPPEPPPPPPEQLPPTPKPDEGARTVRVETNVPGATVTLRIYLFGGLPDPDPIVVTTGPDGSAEIPLPDTPEAIAEMIAEARAPGHGPAKERVRKGVARITLQPGVPVRGKVVDRAGEPVAKVTIATGPETWAHTGDSGSFEIWLPEAGPAALSARSQFWLNTSVDVNAPADDVRIIMERGLTISGRVSFPDGRPVPGVWLQAAGVSARAKTDAEGRYVLAGFERGRVKVNCLPAGEKREVDAGASGVDFVVKTHVVRIRFTDEEGRPYRNASVWIRGYLKGEKTFTSASSIGEDGIDMLDGVATGMELRVSPSAPGRRERISRMVIDGPPRMHDAEIVLPREGPKGTVELRVLDAVGEPMRKAVIFLYNEAGSPVSGFYELKVELDETGRCRLEPPVGKYRLTVGDTGAFATLEGYGLDSVQEIVVTTGETLPVDATVLLGGRINLTVEDPDGEVIATGRVELFDHRDQHVLLRFIRMKNGGWTTDPDQPGPALLGRAVAPGRYKLRLYREQEVVHEQEVDVARGRTTEVRIRLPRR